MSDKKKIGEGGFHNLDNFFHNLDSKFYSITCDNRDERDTFIQYKYICIETGWLTLKNS